MSLYRDVMGKEAPERTAPAAEYASAASQFGYALVTRLAQNILGPDRMEFSKAITDGMRYTRRSDRDAVRRELQAFLGGTVQIQAVAIPVWLQLCADDPESPGLAMRWANAYGLDTSDVGRAMLVGLDRDRVETLLHMISVIGGDPFVAVCDAVQREINAGRSLDEIATGGALKVIDR